MDTRQAQAADEGAIRDCAVQAYTQYVSKIGKKPAPMVADFAALIAAGHVYVAADAQGDLLGFIVFFQKGDHMFLENVAVWRMAAGRGIGKHLIAFCEAAAKRATLSAVTLYTNEKMTANLSLYPHLGYHETGRKSEGGFNRVYFEKAV